MFSLTGKKRALIVANTYMDKTSRKNKIRELPSCEEDLLRIKPILIKLGFEEIHVRKDVKVDKYIQKMFKHSKDNDTIFIHFSGHGEKVGLPIENHKVRLISAWLNPDMSLFLSSTLEKMITNIKHRPNIIISSDSCYSGRFFNDYENVNNLPIYFIGSSTGMSVASAYAIDDENKAGSLTLMYDYIFSKQDNPSFEDFQNLSSEFIEKFKIGKNRIILKNVI